jgi:uncharacterized membrane protein
MAEGQQRCSDEYVEQVVGDLLRVGVITAAAVVLLGTVVYLYGHYADLIDLRVYHSEPEELRQPARIVKAALMLHGRGLIQLGLLLLIATPVARVVFSVFAFACQRDYTYIVVTCIVLAVLLYSLFGGSLIP